MTAMFSWKKLVLNLNCWITRDSVSSAFPVTMPGTATVHQLKEEIISNNIDLKDTPARSLLLWVVLIPLPLAEPGPKNPRQLEDAKLVEGTRPLGECFAGNPVNNCLHIIVEVPKCTHR
jgi:hypothetical protein